MQKFGLKIITFTIENFEKNTELGNKSREFRYYNFFGNLFVFYTAGYINYRKKTKLRKTEFLQSNYSLQSFMTCKLQGSLFE